MREFKGGAVRDDCAGKGRFDIVDMMAFCNVDGVLDNIGLIQLALMDGVIDKALCHVRIAIDEVIEAAGYDAILEMGKVAEKGAEKYGVANYQKGIPASSLIDSAIRHWCKYRQGWKDENHLGSALWNLSALHWTLRKKPEFNDYCPDDEPHETYAELEALEQITKHYSGENNENN